MELERPEGEAARGTLAAWAVHAFTATGAVLALLALLAVERGDFAFSLLWLAAALGVDAIDGTLARAAHVKTRLPRIDGSALDLIIDYLTYVFVPALMIVRAELVPAAWAPVLAAAILVSSLYVFARADMKTEDNYFRGFPALWNVVAFYLYVAQPGETVGGVLVALLVVATFAPIHFVHPFRVRDYGRFLPTLALAWAAATIALLWPDWNEAARRWLLLASSAAGLTLIALGLWRSLQGARLTS